jgi:aspartyl-tRNA(Asn)/glutamyl-tRNA(Gln) amidotransferase subunit A
MGGFTAPFSLTGSPAISVPGGTTDSGLPIGVQLVGPLHGDRLVIRAARALEVARPWARVAPVA